MKRFKSIATAAFLVLATVAYALPALPAAAQSSASLSIVPKKTYTIEPGKSIKDTLTIRNLDAEKTLDLSLRVIDFTFTDDGGTPKLMLAENAPQTTWSLKPFLTVPETVSIPPKTSKTLDMGVAIPTNQGAGSYYSAILYSSSAPDGGNVGLSASGVTLVFTTIPGEVDERLTLENFGAYHNARSGKPAGYVYLATEKPQTIAYTLKNDGNVTESPVGSITIKHMFGAEQVISDVNPNESLALIGQTRTFTSCIKLDTEELNFNGGTSRSSQCEDPDLLPGYYSASLELYYGQNGNRTQEIVSSASFWYLPWWFIIAFLIVLAIVAYFVWRIVRAVRGRLYGPKRPRNVKLTRRR